MRRREGRGSHTEEGYQERLKETLVGRGRLLHPGVRVGTLLMGGLSLTTTKSIDGQNGTAQHQMGWGMMGRIDWSPGRVAELGRRAREDEGEDEGEGEGRRGTRMRNPGRGTGPWLICPDGSSQSDGSGMERKHSVLRDAVGLQMPEPAGRYPVGPWQRAGRGPAGKTTETSFDSDVAVEEGGLSRPVEGSGTTSRATPAASGSELGWQGCAAERQKQAAHAAHGTRIGSE